MSPIFLALGGCSGTPRRYTCMLHKARKAAEVSAVVPTERACLDFRGVLLIKHELLYVSGLSGDRGWIFGCETACVDKPSTSGCEWVFLSSEGCSSGARLFM